MNFDYLFGTDTYELLSDVVTRPSGVSGLPKFGPKPLVSPFGPGYSMHPELSRSAMGYLVRSVVVSPFFLVPTVTALASVGIHSKHISIVEELPDYEQPSMWQSIAQAMAGGVGVGSATSKYV
jgi:hypothetical protein